jgi:uncharacterized protein (DUF433 family)
MFPTRIGGLLHFTNPYLTFNHPNCEGAAYCKDTDVPFLTVLSQILHGHSDEIICRNLGVTYAHIEACREYQKFILAQQEIGSESPVRNVADIKLRLIKK